MSSETDALIRLPWDSSHFGFEVGTINALDLDDIQLERLIRTARDRNFALVYWVTRPDRRLPSELLGQLGGQLVDHKVTYTRALDEFPLDQEGELQLGTRGQFRVHTVPQGHASEQLIALAVAAGQFSRYRRDSRFPADLTAQLYTLWIERSTLREIAGTVLAVVGTQGNTVGMITVSKKKATCQVGLMAVDASVRRGGIGRLLLSAAHAWSMGQGTFHSTVVTQTENVPACHLYELCGYQVHESRHVYHFWPL